MPIPRSPMPEIDRTWATPTVLNRRTGQLGADGAFATPILKPATPLATGGLQKTASSSLGNPAIPKAGRRSRET